MAGLANWENRSQGPARSRIRRKRLEAVNFYRRAIGPLAEDRLWVGKRLPQEPFSHRTGRHDPRREREHGVLWHET